MKSPQYHSKGEIQFMLYPNYTEELLGLEDVIVESVERKENTLCIYASMHKRIHKCPRCGELTSKVHDYRTQRIKDISAFGEITYIFLRKRRHVCPVCKKRFYEEVPFLPKYHRMTNRLVAYVISSLRGTASMKSIAKNANISQYTVTRIFDQVEYFNKELPKVLSIDEFRGNAGGEKFQCIVTDPENKVVLDILPNRKTEDLTRYFLSFKDSKKVEYFVIDISGPYKSLAKPYSRKLRL